MKERGKRLLFLTILVVLPFLVLSIVEGVSSLIVASRVIRAGRLAEGSHTERDTLLGWINMPNVSRPDHYGPGIGLATNAQRVRHKGTLAPRAAAGRRRVVCVGDSFTLGYGVADDAPWCARLSALDTTIESVNMGQGGYGIDQAYLWYTRDGGAFHPNVTLFAFIADDFRRMQRSSNFGSPKPQLRVEGGRVRAIGVPVPRPGAGPFLDRLATAARSLRSYEVLERLTRRSGGNPSGADSATWEVARAALHEMWQRDSANGTTFVAVYLPTATDHKASDNDKWRRWLAAAAARREFAFVDLTEPFRAIRGDSVDALFIRRGEITFRGANGHYTAKGNAWVAAMMMRLIPALTAPLDCNRPGACPQVMAAAPADQEGGMRATSSVAIAHRDSTSFRRRR